MRIICDTGVISRYLKGEFPCLNKIMEIGLENIYITPIVRIELHRWLSVYKGLTLQQRKFINETIKKLPIIHLNTNISKIAIEISDKDNSLDASDILIGATAIYNKIPLYTINKKHFKRMKGIKLVD